jgi:hypothetical protein
MAKYKVNQNTSILKFNPSKRDMFGDIGTDVVGTLKEGDVIDIAKTGGGGRGIAMTPYLIFADETFIIGYNADKVDDSTPLTPRGLTNLLMTPKVFFEKNKIIILTAFVALGAYFGYKKFMK